MLELDGKVAVVTGAASGLGLAFAERFAREGMRVILADYEAAALERAVQDLRQGEFEVEGVVADVSTQAALDDLAARTKELYGGCHILCNNAGVIADSDLGGALERAVEVPIWEQPLADWRWTFNVNLWGVVHGIRAFVPMMIAQNEEGHVVNTASIAGLIAESSLHIYGASKHAVVRVSEGLYGQLQAADAKIGVSVLCPGGVKTRIGLAERNRPDEFAPTGKVSLEDLTAREKRWADGTGRPSMEPSHVADLVLRAIQDKQFWILPHDEYDESIRARAEDILARHNPTPQPF